MIFNNFGQALRVSVGPYALLIAVSALIFWSLGLISVLGEIAAGQVAPEQLQSFGGSIIIGVLAVVVLAVFVAAWVAVSWHRFILLEEYSGILPAMSGRPIWPYVGKSMLLGLLIVVLGMVIGLILGLVLIPLSAFGEAALVLGGAVISMLMVAILSLMWFRMGVALPATAVGKPIKLGEAWEATSKVNGTIIGIVLIIAVVSFIAGVATQGLYEIHPILGVVTDLFVQWVNLMIGVSILTTLYGHVIEGRPLID
ncbi:hypothetical protein DS901_17750 [Loktanella sp. D2R18]|uniref:hypothetical protein n=1 Tax=Rhodobacterales TaxID=204455 RepID=UPI000DE876C6|nr:MULTISPECIES: hypothetical protein [Rhodobacterales]MDO6590440.1 hypothetical protein [Yoonia sp. 1_MG-2023]RBW41163.1 hypothetical protein DS901_17750 [Loktanella sp. D2R18]